MLHFLAYGFCTVCVRPSKNQRVLGILLSLKQPKRLLETNIEEPKPIFENPQNKKAT